MNKFLAVALLVLAAVCPASAQPSCLDQTLEVSFCADETAANQVIAREFDALNNGEPFGFDILDGRVSFEVQAPDIEFTPGFARLNTRLTVLLEQDILPFPLRFDFDFNPSVAIDYSTSLGEIQGLLNSVPDIVNSIDFGDIPLPPAVIDVLRAEIINAYEGLEFTVFPQRILDEANSLVPGAYDVTVEDIGITIVARDGFLEIEFDINVQACEPLFGVYDMYELPINGVQRVFVTVEATVEATVDRVDIYDLNGNLVISNDTDVAIPVGQSELNVGPDQPRGIHTVNVFFRIPNNIYLEWAFVMN